MIHSSHAAGVNDGILKSEIPLLRAVAAQSPRLGIKFYIADLILPGVSNVAAASQFPRPVLAPAKRKS